MKTFTTLSSLSKTVYAVSAALAMISASATATTISFNPSQPLVVTDAGGFTGSTTLQTGYSKAQIFFDFSGLSAELADFQISNIVLKGDGITGSLNYSPVTITDNNIFGTGFINLTTGITNLDFANSKVSFSIAGEKLNLNSQFSIFVQYSSSNGFQQNTSSGGNLYAAVPEPSATLLSGLGLLLFFRRRR